MKLNCKNYSSLFLLAFIILSYGCEDEVVVIPPVPSEIFPDCSYSFVTSVLDTNSFLPFEGPGGFVDNYYEGYEIRDISFNPNDPNKIVVAMIANNIPAYGIANETGILVIVNLCTGKTNLVSTDYYDNLTSVDWGVNGTILFSTQSSVRTINSNGAGLVEIPTTVNLIKHVTWCPDQESILVTSASSTIVSEVSLNGTILSDDIGLESSLNFSYLPDNRLSYIGANVGVYDPVNGLHQVLDNVMFSQFDPGISYSSFYNRLLWCNDSIVATTSLINNQRTVLSVGFTPNKYYHSTTASKNGYLAYVARVVSPSLSTPTWLYHRTEIRFINPDGTDERRLVLDFE